MDQNPNAAGFIDPEMFFSCFLVTVPHLETFQGSPLSVKLLKGHCKGPAAIPHPCWLCISGSL